MAFDGPQLSLLLYCPYPSQMSYIPLVPAMPTAMSSSPVSVSMRASEFAAIEFVAAEQARAVLDCVAAHRVVLGCYTHGLMERPRPVHSAPCVCVCVV